MTGIRLSGFARADLLQFARFVVVGVVNTAFSYAVFALLVYAGLDYVVANLIAFVTGLLFTFKTQGTIVFRNADNRRILRFVFAWLLIYGFNIFVISRFLALGLNTYASGALALPFVTLLSYLVQRFFVFRTSPVDVAE